MRISTKYYNPKGADKLGIVYTPLEVVDFMIRSADHLLKKHFHKNLNSPQVNILDPATGTGTFITELLEYMFAQAKTKKDKTKVQYKYQNEIFCNEVSILSYYIANLSIEKTYFDHTKTYEPFNNIAYVDTLDNIFFKGSTLKKDQKRDLFSSVTIENLERIQKQNEKEISVIIGNPPYNANQQNENQNNKNREYTEVDQKIKETYVKQSKAQKSKVYDMYARFIRYATDRLGDNGVIAFITNNSFIDSYTYDGFRKCVQKDFDYIYVINLDGDVRKDTRISGTKNNVFGIQTGVAIFFLIRLKENANKKAVINYVYATHSLATKEEKFEYLKKHNISNIPFETLKPDEKGYWLNTNQNDFYEHIPVISKNKTEKTIFKVSSLGVVTARDLWVYDFDKNLLQEKVKYFIDVYNELIKKYKGNEKAFGDTRIKWSATLKNYFHNKNNISKFSNTKIIKSLYRPFTFQFYYSEKKLSDRLLLNNTKNSLAQI